MAMTDCDRAWLEFTQGMIFSQEMRLQRRAFDAGWLAALEKSAIIAIDKGVGNGHLETCAYIADQIRALKVIR